MARYLFVYLVFGVVWSSYRFLVDYDKAKRMLEILGFKNIHMHLFKRYLQNIVLWLPNMIVDLWREIR